ncbi:MAG: methyltransferase [Nanoarchaeota archaeon]
MVYPPSEDSLLLEEQVKIYLAKLSNKEKFDFKILDMGSGSGIQALAAIKSGIRRKNILCADIDEEAIKGLKEQALNAIHTNLFSNIGKGKKFNLIVFNAPYLPADKYDSGLDTTAGKRGYEIIVRFLKQAKLHLEKNAAIFLLFSSLSKPKIIFKEAKKLGYVKKKLSEENMGMMEQIFVYRFN